MKLKPFDKIHNVRICTGLTHTQKLILLIIATHLGKNEFCHLSINTLMAECCIKKRNSITTNIDFLASKGILWKLPPSKGFKSNRYGIDYNLLVTVGYQCSNLGLPEGLPTVTSGVTLGYPKRKLNRIKRKLKENLVDNSPQKAEEARQQIRIKCGIKNKDKRKEMNGHRN